MKINKGDLFFIETNIGSNIFEVIGFYNENVRVQDMDHVYQISKSTLSTFEFLEMGIVYLGKL